jgi:beta-lactam-binding protein with PASTA domain
MWVVPEGVEMPQVWHLPLEEARAALDAVGIPHRISFAQSQTIPEGELLSVAPPTGATVAPGMEALLMVSSGPPVVPHRGWALH